MTAPSGDRIVIRGASGWWISGVLAAILVAMLVDAAVRGEWRTVLIALPWICVALLICWMLLIRPCLVITRSTLTVVNILRTHTLPWRDVADLQVRYQLVVTRADGTVIRAWGSPTVHPRRDADPDGPGRPRSRAFVGVVEAIDQARDALGRTADEEGRSTSRVVWWPLAALVAAAAVGVVTARLLL